MVIIYIMKPDLTLFKMPIGLIVAIPLIGILLWCSVSDIKHRIIPNRKLGAAVLAVLLYQLIYLRFHSLDEWVLISHIGVAFVISGVLFCVCLFTGALGAGDAKMAFLFGLFGRRIGLLTVGLAFVMAAVLSVVIILFNGRSRSQFSIPLAPFFTLSFILVFFAETVG